MVHFLKIGYGTRAWTARMVQNMHALCIRCMVATAWNFPSTLRIVLQVINGFDT